MDTDPGEGASDGIFKRTPKKRKTKREPNSNGAELMSIVKVEIKEEPEETSAVHEYRRLPTEISANNSIGLQSDSSSDDQLDSDDDINIEWMKKEIKTECEEEKEVKSKEKSDGEQNEQSNDIDVDDRGQGDRNVSTTSSKDNYSRRSSNGKGRNRILTKKRNMSNGSKKSRAKERKIHKCHLCKYTTTTKSNLTTHICTHTGEQPFQCELCSKAFTLKNTLDRHNKTQHSQFEFHCSKCQSGFSNQINKMNHENKCHVRQFECYMCKFSTLHMTHLKYHIKAHHSGEKPFECSVCSKSFTTKCHLISHLRVHKKQLPLDCSKCGRRFDNENERESHEKRCNGRRFECHLCRYKSFNRGHMKQHIRAKHTGGKQFTCLVCDKKFVLKGNLNKHLATHSEQRPIRCRKCLRQFKDKDEKTTHENQCRCRHYECYLCSNKYQHLWRLKSHMEKDHIGKKSLLR